MTSPRRLNYDKIRYKATLESLSPIHIGSGEPEPACRYAIDSNSNKAFVLTESFAASRFAEGRVTGTEYHRKPSPLSVLPKEEPERSETILYTLDAGPASKQLDKQASPFIRNGFGQGYIPGTSIKGAIRGALLFSHLLQDDGLKAEIKALTWSLISEMKQSNPRSAGSIRRNKRHARQLEELFRNTQDGGRADPKNDILRCISVEDTPPSDTGFSLEAANIFTLSEGALAPMISARRGGGSVRSAPTFLEVLKPGVSFTFNIDFDKPLLKRLSMGANGVRFRNYVDIIGSLKDHADFTTSLERTFFSEFDASDKLWKSVYEGADLAENQAVIRLGWGCGWMGHSLFPLLAYNENDVAESPKSRKALTYPNGNPLSLLGYAVLTIEGE